MANSDKERHGALIDRISKLPWPQMVDECNAAVAEERKLLDKNALGELGKVFFSMLTEELQHVNSAIAQLRTKSFDLDPDTFTFELFRNKRLAETFKQYPHMVEVMKARATVESYYVGVKAALNLYEMIAADPDHYTNKVATAIADDNKVSMMPDPENDGTLAETIEAMENYVDYFNASICSSYFQYKAIPTKYDGVVVQGRVTRKRGGTNDSTDLCKVPGFDFNTSSRAETPRMASPSVQTPQAPKKIKGQSLREDSPALVYRPATRRATRQGTSASINSVALKPTTAHPYSRSTAIPLKVQKHTKVKLSRSDISNHP